VVLNQASSTDEVIEFTNKAATFMRDHSPFAAKVAKPAPQSKQAAVARAATWFANGLKKSHGNHIAVFPPTPSLAFAFAF